MTILFINDYLTNGFKIEIINLIYLFSIIFSIFTIVSRNPIISVLFLIGLFVNISVLLIFVGFNFIGLSYILVYVGAVSILFLFILMLINIRVSELISEFNNDVPLGLITIILFYFVMEQVLPINYLANKNIINKFSDSIIDINNLNSKNLNFNNVFFASSKTWDNSLVDVTHISAIGNIMYTNYAIWLIIVSVILLLAMVGSIVITIKQK